MLPNTRSTIRLAALLTSPKSRNTRACNAGAGRSGGGKGRGGDGKDKRGGGKKGGCGKKPDPPICLSMAKKLESGDNGIEDWWDCCTQTPIHD